MARFIDGALPAPQPNPLGDGSIVMTLADWAALERAPKRRPGTQVTVRAYDVPGIKGPAASRSPDHMYVEYDDGGEQLIARGGPSAQGLGYITEGLQDRRRVVGEVTPAKRSRDYGRGERVVFQGFLPDVSARQAAEPARREAVELERDPRRYQAFGPNSNSYAADVVEPLFGVRPGDGQTPSYRTRLRDAPRTRPNAPFGNALDLLRR